MITNPIVVDDAVQDEVVDRYVRRPGGDPTGPIGSVLPPHVLLGSNDVATARPEVVRPAVTIIRASDEGRGDGDLVTPPWLRLSPVESSV